MRIKEVELEFPATITNEAGVKLLRASNELIESIELVVESRCLKIIRKEGAVFMIPLDRVIQMELEAKKRDDVKLDLGRGRIIPQAKPEPEPEQKPAEKPKRGRPPKGK